MSHENEPQDQTNAAADRTVTSYRSEDGEVSDTKEINFSDLPVLLQASLNRSLGRTRERTIHIDYEADETAKQKAASRQGEWTTFKEHSESDVWVHRIHGGHDKRFSTTSWRVRAVPLESGYRIEIKYLGMPGQIEQFIESRLREHFELSLPQLVRNLSVITYDALDPDTADERRVEGEDYTISYEGGLAAKRRHGARPNG